MVHLEEKIALPRGSDLVRDTLDLIEQGQAEVDTDNTAPTGEYHSA
jgi:hypothetical protein